MPRNILRVSFILFSILLAIFGPFIVSGYFELKKATTSGSYVEVAEHYHNAAQRIPWRADLYELSGNAYYYAKDYIQADALYQKAFYRHAFTPEGWVAWGDVNYLNNNPERATEIWEQALDQKNPSDQLYSRLAEIYQSNGEFSKAAQYLQKYVSVHSDDAFTHYRLGLLLTLSDPDKALSELLDASQLDPELDPAVQTLRTTLNLASLNDSTSARLVVIGRGLGLVNEWQLAHAAFEKAVKMDEKNAEAWAWLGEANQQLGLSKGGSAELDEALNLNPNLSTVRGLRGLYFERAGNFRQALTEFQAAAELEPKNPTWFVSLGESYAKLGDLIQAMNSYQTATTLAPEDANYWRLLAIFCGQNNVNVKDVGVPAAQKAVVLAEEDATSLDVLGWLLLMDARYQEAERILTHALESDSQNASAHMHLGVLYLQTNHRASAYDHLIKARDLGNTDAEMILNQYFP
ncbi:MAG TPA: tetratricopeptide repeat protein [Anaerolineales bacterium]